YRVTAVGWSGTSAPSHVVSAMTLDAIPPSVPGELTAVPTGCKHVSLAWSAATDTGGTGIRAYRLYRNGTVLKDVDGLTLDDGSVVGEARYVYAVSALDGAGNQSALSARATVTTPPCGGSTSSTTSTSTSSTTSTSSSTSTTSSSTSTSSSTTSSSTSSTSS